jgi:hypothetical protein
MTGFTVKGKVQNDDGMSGWTYDVGRAVSGVITGTGAQGGCQFGGEASDYRHVLTAEARAAVRQANEPREAGKACIRDDECQSKVCARDPDPHKMNKCL